METPDHTEWSRKTHDIFGVRPLTADDPRAPPPPGFRGRLWAPQATLLHAMVGLEQRPYLRVEAPPALEDPAALLRTVSARVAAEFSFGKTVLCIALACASPLPRALPTPLALPLMGGCKGANRLAVSEHARTTGCVFKPQGRGSIPSLSLRYQRLLRATLVVAAPSVISQWEGCVEEFAPHLKYFTIENVRTLRQFYQLFRTEAMDGVDLVFLKAGKVTTAFAAEGEPPPQTRQRALTKALAVATEGYVWGRMVVDDFDTIKMTSDDIFLPALFTWVISATCRSTVVRQDVKSGGSVREFLRNNLTLPILSAAANTLYDNVLKLCCEKDYVSAHINSTAVDYRRITVEGGHAVGILQDLGVPDEVVEMAAAGALETAAERLDIKVASIGELVERVLAARTGKYRKAVRVFDLVDRARAKVANSTAVGRPRNTPEEVKKIRAALKHGDDHAADAALAALGAAAPHTAAALSSLEEWAVKERDEHGGRLQRMRENVRQNCCQSCMVPIDDESYIVNCCQIVICGYCIVVGEGGRHRYINRCPNCASDLDPARHLVYVGKDLELERALTDETLLAPAEAAPGVAEASAEPAPAEAAPGVAEATAEPAPGGAEAPYNYGPWADNPRLRALLQLLRRDPIVAVSDEPCAPIVTGLLDGRRHVPRPEDTPQKYLIFAMHPESTRHITAALTAVGIPHLWLAGKRQQKDEVVARFKDPDGVHVMVATSSRDCAGLHLPETSTVVLYNHHNDTEVAKQALGRAQRVGRDYSLEVIVLMNEGEARRFG